jgi:hypothetical protein
MYLLPRSYILGMLLLGIVLCQKKQLFHGIAMYWPVWDFSMLVFCECVIVGVDQNLLDMSLSMSGFIVHLLMLGNRSASIFRLVSRSCLVMYVWRHLTMPLFGRLFGPGQVSF